MAVNHDHQRVQRLLEQARRTRSVEPLRKIEALWLENRITDRTVLAAWCLRDQFLGRIKRCEKRPIVSHGGEKRREK